MKNKRNEVFKNNKGKNISDIEKDNIIRTNNKYQKLKNNEITRHENIKKKKTEYKKLTSDEKEKIKLELMKQKEFPYIDTLVNDKKYYSIINKYFNDKKIVYCDSGMRSPLFMMGYNKNQTNNTRHGKFGDKIFYEYTNKNRLKETKRIKYNKLITSRKKKIKINNISINDHENELTKYNSKSCIHTNFLNFINKKIEINNIVYNEYCNKFYRKLKFYSYINRRKHEEKLISRIKEKFGNDFMIVIGDWGKMEHIKYISTPNITIKRKLKEKFGNVILLDEYNTSKLSYKNNKNVCEHIKINFENRSGKKINKELHSVLTFKMENKCMGCINRDLNAVLNYETIVKSLVQTKNRPEEFKRKYILKQSDPKIVN
jgi:hypothetical protein